MKPLQLLSAAAIALCLFPIDSALSQRHGKSAFQSTPSESASQFRPGDLPVGRWQSTDSRANTQTGGIQSMQIEAGRHYSINGITGDYKRVGNSLLFIGGTLGRSMADLSCKDGFLSMRITLPDQKNQAWLGFSGGRVCP